MLNIYYNKNKSKQKNETHLLQISVKKDINKEITQHRHIVSILLYFSSLINVFRKDIYSETSSKYSEPVTQSFSVLLSYPSPTCKGDSLLISLFLQSLEGLREIQSLWLRFIQVISQIFSNKFLIKLKLIIVCRILIECNENLDKFQIRFR